MKLPQLAAPAALALGLTATAAVGGSGPGIESLSIGSAAGPVVIEVAFSVENGYRLKTKILPLKMKVHARATSGSRIVAAAIGAGDTVHVFEAGGWKHVFSHADVGGGSLRTFDWTGTVNLPEKKADWVGYGPERSCMEGLKGLSSAAVRAKRKSGYVVQAKMDFAVNALAKLKGFASDHASLQDKDFNRWVSKTTHATYPAVIKCLPAQTHLNMVDGPKPGQPNPSTQVHLPMKVRR